MKNLLIINYPVIIVVLSETKILECKTPEISDKTPGRRE